MFHLRRIAISAVIILFFSFAVFAQRLNKYNGQKLSPSLYELMHNKSSQQTFQPGNISVQSAGVDNNGNELYGVIIKTTDKNQLKNLNVNINSDFKDYVTARVTLDEVVNIMNLSSVSFIGIGETLYPTNDIANAAIGADLLHSGYFITNFAFRNFDVNYITNVFANQSFGDWRGNIDFSFSRIDII